MATAAQAAREQRIAAELAQSASLAQPAATLATSFPEHDKVLAEEVKRVKDSSEEFARLRSSEAREQYEQQVKANVLRERQRAEEKQAEIDRYHAQQQARDSKAEAEVARRFQVLSETREGPSENIWTMSPARQRYMAETASLAQKLLSPEQMEAFNHYVDPFYGPADPLAQTQALAQQRPEREQPREQTQERPATFADGKFSHITDNGDGTVLVELPTGEKFKGDWQTVAELQAKSIAHTKAWGKAQRAQAQQSQPAEPQQPTNANSVVSFAPGGSPQLDFSKIPDVTRWQMDQMAQSLGYSDGAEMVQDQIAQRSKTQDLERRLQEREERDFILETSSNFLAANPDFPNTDQSIVALEQIINGNGWQWTPETMQAAHALATRQGMYQPLSVAEQSGQWEQNLRDSNRPVPPPMPSGQSPDNGRQEPNLWTEDMAEQRKRIIREQLLEKGRF